MHELLFPRTDAGVLTQLIAVGVAGIGLAVVLRRQSEMRVLVIGITIVLVALIGVRALH